MFARLGALFLVALTALYCYGLGWIAYGFARSGTPIGWGLALGVGIIVVLTVWVTWREVLFGIATTRAARAYRDALTAGTIATPLDDPRAEFEAARAALQAATGSETAPDGSRTMTGSDPNSELIGVGQWHAWYRLGLAYEALSDRKHARDAVRRALRVRREMRQ